MASLVTLTYSQPTRSLASGEILVREGDEGRDLYVLASGRLVVERNGTVIARLAEPGALVGEMSVLTGSRISATVKADGAATVRVVADAMRYISRQPDVAVHIAVVLAQRLDATSAVLSELGQDTELLRPERNAFSSLVTALFGGSK